MNARSLLVLIPLFACGGGGADVEPKSGTWSYGGSMVESNNCGGDPITDPAGNFTLTTTGAGKFSVDDNDFDGPFDCTHDGGSFSCPDRVAKSVMDNTLDALVELHVGVEGSLDSATALSGVQTVDVSCTGTGCDFAKEIYNITMFPCSYSFSFEATTK